jgi:hypothetical protein
MMDLRVPVMPVEAEVLTADGQRLRGRIFLPTAASRHSGPMRPAEWMNQFVWFFPFHPQDAHAPIILNKQSIVMITVDASFDKDELPEGAPVPTRQVVVEAEGNLRLQGMVVLDMPQNRTRVLDLLNGPGMFVTLREGSRHHLVLKERILRVRELDE